MRRVWVLIGVLTLVLIAIFGNRIWNVRFLYTRSEARADMVMIMKAFNEEKGWSASDLQLERIICTEKCIFSFRYQYRGPFVRTDFEELDAWVENGQVKFEIVYE